LIGHLQDENDTPCTSHSDKERLLWEAFKERLGVSEFFGFYFDINMFIQRADDLENLEQNFTEAEIDNIIKALPNDKSPRPDDFNNEFLKKCWSIIKYDFYKLYHDFQQNTVCLRSINSSFISYFPRLLVLRPLQNLGPSLC